VTAFGEDSLVNVIDNSILQKFWNKVRFPVRVLPLAMLKSAGIVIGMF
jgi:hypothetical protein